MSVILEYDYRRCVLQHRTDPERHRPARRGWLCEGHYLNLEQHLAELPHDALEAQRSLIRSGTHGPKVSGDPETPVPFDERASDAMTGMRDLLACWTKEVVDEHPSRLHTPPVTLPGLATFLFRHLVWIVDQSWISVFHQEFGDARYQLRAALNPSHSRKVPLGSCEQPLWCDLGSHDVHLCEGTLQATVHLVSDGTCDPITCTDCAFDHHPMTWPKLSRRLRKDAKPMLTYAQLSQLLVVPIGTLKRWNHEDDWRGLDARPARFHLEDAQRSFDSRRQDVPA